MGIADWTTRAVYAVAVINGTAYDIVRLVVSYEINGVPQAQLSLSVGREILTGSLSTVHTRLQSKLNQQPIDVYLYLPEVSNSRYGNDLGIPPSGVLHVFRGMTNGVSDRKTAGGFEVTITARHILARLTESSCLSDTSTPTNPASYTYGAFGGIGAPGKAGLNRNTSMVSAERFTTTVNINDDLWGKVLYPYLVSLTAVNMLRIDAGVNVDESTKKNDRALSGLILLEPTDPKKTPYLKSGLPLEVTEDLASMLAQDIRNITSDVSRLAGQTMWHLIMNGFVNRYLMALIPLGVRAMVVPFVPGCRTQWKTINGTEYDYKEVMVDTPQPLRAIGVLANVGYPANTNGAAADATPATYKDVAGWAEFRDDGMIEMVEAPPWVLFPVSPTRFAAAASGVKGAENAAKPPENKCVASAIDPDAADPPDPLPADAAEDNESLLNHFINAYARYVFATRSLSTRQAQLSGPMRFDICPGSTVRLEGINSDYLAGGGFGQYFFATVLRVTLSIDCEASKAGMSFQLGYMRDATENKEDATSIATHPLYNNVFTGTYLATEPQAGDHQQKAMEEHLARARDVLAEENPNVDPPPPSDAVGVG